MLKRDKSLALSKKALMESFDELHSAVGRLVFGKAGLDIGDATKKTVSVNADLTYSIDGVAYSFARDVVEDSPVPEEVAFTADDHDIPANATLVQEACYLVVIDSEGVFDLVMGEIASGGGQAKLPEVPEGVAVVGYVRVSVAAGSTIFNATTNDLDASHLTVAYTDLSFLFGRFDSVQ